MKGVLERLRTALLDNVPAEDRDAVGYAFDLALADVAIEYMLEPAEQ